MLFNLYLHFPVAILGLINLFNVDWAVRNEFASVTTCCLLIVLLTINVTLILFLIMFIQYQFHFTLIENHFTPNAYSTNRASIQQ